MCKWYHVDDKVIFLHQPILWMRQNKTKKKMIYKKKISATTCEKHTLSDEFFNACA